MVGTHTSKQLGLLVRRHYRRLWGRNMELYLMLMSTLPVSQAMTVNELASHMSRNIMFASGARDRLEQLKVCAPYS